MERRKFFKSLGLLSIAAVLPKFLFGKEEKAIQVKILDDGTQKRGETWKSYMGERHLAEKDIYKTHATFDEVDVNTLNEIKVKEDKTIIFGNIGERWIKRKNNITGLYEYVKLPY